MLDSAKRVCLFIGMVVGAGFATGRELALYFSTANTLTLVMTSVFMALSYALFLIVGRSGSYLYLKNSIIGHIMSCVMRLAVVAGFVVMTAGAEELLYEVIGVRYIGVLTGIISAFIVSTGMRGVKGVSVVLVPLLLCLIFVLSHGAYGALGSVTSARSALTYVGMNMLMAGYIILEEGEHVSNRDIAISSTLVAVIFAVILVVVMRAIGDYTTCTMPIYALSVARGHCNLGALLIFIAILTTLIGYGTLIYEGVQSLFGYRSIALMTLVVLSAISAGVHFVGAVALVYSIEGIIGLIFVFYVLIGYIYMRYVHIKNSG